MDRQKEVGDINRLQAWAGVTCACCAGSAARGPSAVKTLGVSVSPCFFEGLLFTELRTGVSETGQDTKYIQPTFPFFRHLQEVLNKCH